ncbi:MAG: hypothetical protein Q9195_004918 [Heterodermia aff. obscurata]
MLVAASKSSSYIITSYNCPLLPPLLLRSNIRLIRCRASQTIRQNNTATADYSGVLEHAETQQSAVQGILSSPRRREPEAWVALVDEFLPQSLRSTQIAGSGKPAEDTKDLPALLSKARSTTPLRLDVLSYIGIHLGRLDAVKWLFRSLSRDYQATAKTKEHKRNEGVVPWSVAEPNPYGVTSLHEICSIPIVFDTKAVQSAQVSGYPTEICLGFDSEISRPEWLGQIWATLAHMILRAAEYSANHADGQKIMSFVLETLGHLHHIGAVPHTIYTYRETNNANGSSKPPTLSLMAHRMMSVLSDVAWKSQDEEIGVKGKTSGEKKWFTAQELPKPTIQPRTHKVGLETWLDLILWCCVEGGYYTEAAWVIHEMLKQKSRPRWRVIGWSEIRRPEEPEVNWSVRAEVAINRFHMSQTGPGFDIAGSKSVPPLVDIGPWTVSREVILTLIDGLATSLRPIIEVEQQIAWCRDLLRRDRSLTPETNNLNKAVWSMFMSNHVDAEETPEVADRVLALALVCDRSGEECYDSPQSEILEKSHDNEVAAPFLGLLHRTLYSHTIKGNIQAALRAFRNIQKIIDADRRRHIIEFAEDLKRAERTGGEDRLSSESINSIIPSVYPQIPAHILSAFLNLLTDTYLYDLGNWLLYSEEVDGPLIPRSFYSEPNFQSALLRFATATKNGELFSQVSEKLKAPLATDILRTILRCQITLGKWDAVEDVLRHFQLDHKLGWQDTDIMFVAREVLRLDKSQGLQRESLARAQTLLQQLVEGEFNLSHDPSRVLTVLERWRRLNQIYLMLRTVPSCLQELEEPQFVKIRRMTTPIEISSEAFNVLLEGIVERHGSLAGLELWKRWCRPAPSDSSCALLHVPGDWDEARLVKPTLRTLRVLTRPLVRQGTVRDEDETQLVEWAVQRYRDFGLTESQILWELPKVYCP